MKLFFGGKCDLHIARGKMDISYEELESISALRRVKMERQRMIEVDVFMLTWNLKDYTMGAVDTLLRVTEYPFHLYINDNGSVDGTREYLKKTAKKDKRVTLILHDKLESSLCQALNECLRASRSPYVCVVQNDEIFVSGKWLGELVKTLEKDPKIGMVGAKLLYPNGTIQHAGTSIRQEIKVVPLGVF
jgi:GT2 family glycosyltransferase